MSPTKNELMAVSKASVLILLVAVNYGFDWWRRFDFESERKEIAHHISRAEAQIDNADLIAYQFQNIARKFEERFVVIDENLSALQPILTTLIANSRKNVPPGPLDAGEVEKDRSNPLPVESLTTLEEAPNEYILSKIDSIQGNAYLTKFYSAIMDLKAWTSDSLLEDLENEFEQHLEDGERQIIKYKIEAYRQATKAALSRYEMQLNLSLAERLANGLYEPQGEDGKFVTSMHDESKRAEVLAEGTFGRNYIAWKKSDYPELHRMDCLFKAIPVVMLEDLRQCFRKE